MGFKGYIFRYDAIYGTPSYWTNNNNNISKNSVMVTIGLVWTVDYIGLICKQ